MEALKNKNMDVYSKDIYDYSLAEDFVRPKSRSKSKTQVNIYELKKIFVISASILSFLLIIYMVLGYTEMVSINSKNKILQGENERLQLTIDSLELKLDPFVSKERIEKIASGRLGMVYPSEKNIVRLKTTDRPAKQFAEEETNKDTDEKSLLSYLNSIIR